MELDHLPSAERSAPVILIAAVFLAVYKDSVSWLGGVAASWVWPLPSPSPFIFTKRSASADCLNAGPGINARRAQLEVDAYGASRPDLDSTELLSQITTDWS